MTGAYDPVTWLSDLDEYFDDDGALHTVVTGRTAHVHDWQYHGGGGFSCPCGAHSLSRLSRPSVPKSGTPVTLPSPAAPAFPVDVLAEHLSRLDAVVARMRPQRTRSPLRVQVNIARRVWWINDAPAYKAHCEACGWSSHGIAGGTRHAVIVAAEQHAEKCTPLARLWGMTLYNDVKHAAFLMDQHAVGPLAATLAQWRRWAE